MAAKKINRVAKLELIGGQAKPGPALASVGINMGEFTRQFNEKTKDRNGDVVPTIITAYADKTFIFEVKTTPTTVLLKKAAGIQKGAKVVNKENVGKISKEKALEIARYKLIDANALDEQAMLRMIAGTAKQMGLVIEGVDPDIKKVKNKLKDKL